MTHFQMLQLLGQLKKGRHLKGHILEEEHHSLRQRASTLQALLFLCVGERQRH